MKSSDAVQQFAAGSTALTGRALSSNVRWHENSAVSTSPSIQKMASGNLSLLITEEVSWETFPEQAAEFVSLNKGTILKKIDTPVERLWIVLIKWRPFWLTFDDFPLGMSLDSMLSICNPVVLELHKQLSEQEPPNNSFQG